MFLDLNGLFMWWTATENQNLEIMIGGPIPHLSDPTDTRVAFAVVYNRMPYYLYPECVVSATLLLISDGSLRMAANQVPDSPLERYQCAWPVSVGVGGKGIDDTSVIFSHSTYIARYDYAYDNNNWEGGYGTSNSPGTDSTLCIDVSTLPNVTDHALPQEEVDALIEFYEDAYGPYTWIDKGGWGTSDHPCTWFGVACLTFEPNDTLAVMTTGPGGVYRDLTSPMYREIGWSAEENNKTYVAGLFLELNGLYGTMPSSISNLKKAVALYLKFNPCELKTEREERNEEGGRGGKMGPCPYSWLVVDI